LFPPTDKNALYRKIAGESRHARTSRGYHYGVVANRHDAKVAKREAHIT